MMNVFDTETFLITPTAPIPPVVSLAHVNTDSEDPEIELLHHEDGRAWWREKINDPTQKFCGQNMAFDFGVMVRECPETLAAAFQAYADGRVQCTQTRERLLSIRSGNDKDRASMQAIAARRLGLDLSAEKKDPKAWRLRYSELFNVPVAQWPKKAADYAMDDVHITREIFFSQERDGAPADEQRQTRAAWCLHLMAAHGVKVDLARLRNVKATLTAELVSLRDVAVNSGLMRCNVSVKKNAERIKADLEAAGVDVQLTKKGAVSLARPSVKRYVKALSLGRELATKYGGAPECLRDIHDAAAALEKYLNKGTNEDAEKTLIKCGWLTREVKLTKDLKLIREAVARVLGASATQTEKGAVSTARADLRRAADAAKKISASGDHEIETIAEGLSALADASKPEKYLSTYVAAMECGYLHNRYGLVASGRTSASGPNVQNFPRQGGIRECVIPRPGAVFLQADYTQIEMVVLAYLLDKFFGGESSLTKALKEGKDTHIMVAANIEGISYEESSEAYKNKNHPLHTRLAGIKGDAANPGSRQVSKIANYGFAGGMSAATFVDYAAVFGVELTLEQAERIKQIWLTTWVEMPAYFKLIGQWTRGGDGRTTIEQPTSGRLRGGAGFCAAANTLFQGGAADGAKDALWLISWACYVDKDSILYGCRPCLFVHDEFILEAPDDHHADARLAELVRLMCEGMRGVLGDYPVEADGKKMRRWSK